MHTEGLLKRTVSKNCIKNHLTKNYVEFKYMHKRIIISAFIKTVQIKSKHLVHQV